MLRSILKLQRAIPISVGLGGPFSGLLHALTGIHKILPFWALCPLWCLFFAPLILLFPIIVPIYSICILQMMYRKRDVYYYLPEEELSDEFLESDAHIQERRFRNIYLENAPSSQFDSVHGLNADKVLAHGVSAKEKGFSPNSKETELAGKEAMNEAEDEHKIYLHNVVGLIQISIKSNLLHHKHMLVFSQLCYWMLIAVISYGIAYFSFLAFQDYSQSVSSTSYSLQVATPELIAYADKITTIFTTGGMMIWFSMIYFIALALSIAIGSNRPGTTARKFLAKNFLALAVVSCLLCSIGILLERTYSHYVLVAYKDIILGREAINPAYIFLILRALVVYVFTMGLSLCVMMSLRILPLSFKKDSNNWPKVKEPVDKGTYKPNKPKHSSQDNKNQHCTQEQSQIFDTFTHGTHNSASLCHYSFLGQWNSGQSGSHTCSALQGLTIGLSHNQSSLYLA